MYTMNGEYMNINHFLSSIFVVPIISRNFVWLMRSTIQIVWTKRNTFNFLKKLFFWYKHLVEFLPNLTLPKLDKFIQRVNVSGWPQIQHFIQGSWIIQCPYSEGSYINFLDKNTCKLTNQNYLKQSSKPNNSNSNSILRTFCISVPKNRDFVPWRHFEAWLNKRRKQIARIEIAGNESVGNALRFHKTPNLRFVWIEVVVHAWNLSLIWVQPKFWGNKPLHPSINRSTNTKIIHQEIKCETIKPNPFLHSLKTFSPCKQSWNYSHC